MNQSLRLAPEFGEGYAARSLVYFSMGKAQEAGRDKEKALKLGVDPSYFDQEMPGGRRLR